VNERQIAHPRIGQEVSPLDDFNHASVLPAEINYAATAVGGSTPPAGV
jgi:hypothetical protein